MSLREGGYGCRNGGVGVGGGGGLEEGEIREVVVKISFLVMCVRSLLASCCSYSFDRMLSKIKWIRTKAGKNNAFAI